MSKILLVDDDLQSLDSTKRILEFADYEVVTAGDGQAALQALSPEVDLVVTDVRMPRLGGLEFLRALSLRGENTPVILMTAFGRVEDAVWAMKFGAVDFLTKPFKRQQLLSSVESALKRCRKRQSVGQSSEARVSPRQRLMVGESESMRELRDSIAQVAPTSATVLIVGESGTGKEMVARRVHELSSRADRPFIALNCASLPEQLIESELFGYEKGAFTGATGAKAGLFEAADGGTLLLDEIGDMPLALQSRLLRVLQEGEVRRVGAHHSRKCDVRVIAATHRNLRQAVLSGAFRQDLLFRLEVIVLSVPPLRDRRDDIPLLARHFVEEAARRHGKSLVGISADAMAVLTRHDWPGNVRELSNVMERAVVFAAGKMAGTGAADSEIRREDLPPHLASLAGAQGGREERPVGGAISVPLGTPLKDVEEMLIRKTLEATDGDKNMTAKLLGINSRTIYRKLDGKNPDSQ